MGGNVVRGVEWPVYLCWAALLIVHDLLRCGFAYFKRRAHFLQARSKRFDLLLLYCSLD